jgi:hypothetical protein
MADPPAEKVVDVNIYHPGTRFELNTHEIPARVHSNSAFPALIWVMADDYDFDIIQLG